MKVRAIIDIGGYTVRLAIYQVRKEGVTQLEALMRPLSLGHDVFRTGRLSIATMDGLCEILRDFLRTVKEYGGGEVRVIATSAIREAANHDILLSRVSSQCGLEVIILSAPEEARIVYQALQSKVSYKDYFALMVGTSSLTLYYVREGRLLYCESVGMGSLRFTDEFGSPDVSRPHIAALLTSLNFAKRIRQILPEGGSFEGLKLIAMGAGTRTLGKLAGTGKNRTFERALALDLLDRAQQSHLSDLVKEAGFQELQAAQVPATATIILSFMQQLGSSQLLFSPLNTRDAVAMDWVAPRTFQDELLSITESLGRKYDIDLLHAQRTSEIALLFLEKLSRLFVFPTRAEMLLLVAARLHDVGRYVSHHHHELHSAYLVNAMQLPGLSNEERELVSMICCYHRNRAPASTDAAFKALAAQERVLVTQLSAVLRLADSLARYTTGTITLTKSGHALLIACECCQGIPWQDLYWKSRAELFTEAFGLTATLTLEK